MARSPPDQAFFNCWSSILPIKMHTTKRNRSRTNIGDYARSTVSHWISVMFGIDRGEMWNTFSDQMAWGMHTQGALAGARDPGLCCKTPSALKRKSRIQQQFSAFSTKVMLGEASY